MLNETIMRVDFHEKGLEVEVFGNIVLLLCVAVGYFKH